MKDHTGDFLGFYHAAEAWHWPASKTGKEVDVVTFGYFSPEGGTSGEMRVQWVDLSNKCPVPQLCVFDDAWHALAQMPELIQAMGELDDENISPRAFCDLLLSLGFRDLTQRARKGDELRMDLLVQLRNVHWSEMPTDVLERVVKALA